MISALVLAAALGGQINASDGPPREWLQADVNGKTVWMWGWRDTPTGGVRYFVKENGHIFAPPKVVAKPAVVLPKPLGAGNLIEANGSINGGLYLKGAHKTDVGFDTNDPKLAQKLEDRCPNTPDPEPEPDPIDPDAPAPMTDEVKLALALAVGGVAIWLLFRDKEN